MCMVRLVIDDQHISRSQTDALAEIRHIQLLSWRLRTEHSRHRIRLILAAFVCALIELLDIGQKQHPLSGGLFGLAAHHAIELPKDFQFSGNNRVRPEDALIGKISLQPLKHNHVRSNHQKRLGVILCRFVRFSHRVEKLPRNRQRHHLGLARAGCHLDAVAGEFVVRRKPHIAQVLRVPLQQIPPRANLLKLPNKDQRFDGFLL